MYTGASMSRALTFLSGVEGWGGGEGVFLSPLFSFPPTCKVSLCNLGGFPGTLDQAGLELLKI